jgi:hypothetical protein
METICGETSQFASMSYSCLVYDFQTLLIGVIAIIVAIFAGIPVWRQLRDTNLQTRISHRETLTNLLRDALRRYERVDQSIRKPLSMASDVTSDPSGEPIEIDPHDAHHLEQMFSGALDWYLIVLADTEHSDVEAEKRVLKSSLDRLTKTLGEAHWADHNFQQDEDHNISDDDWAKIVARCAQAKIEVAEQVGEVQSAYRKLRDAQNAWIQTLRGKLAKLDLQIAAQK